MFYILIIIGILFIFLGIYINKNSDKSINKNKKDADITSYREVEELYILDKRVAELERLFSIEDDLDREDEVLLIEKYEAQGYSIEEICKLLDMSKGEVLLLKKLKKDYLD